jgi:hypothetical protein
MRKSVKHSDQSKRESRGFLSFEEWRRRRREESAKEPPLSKREHEDDDDQD